MCMYRSHHCRCSLSLRRLLHLELSASSPLCRRQIFVAASCSHQCSPLSHPHAHASALPSPRLASSLTLQALVTPDRIDHRCFSTPDPSVWSAGYKYLQCRAWLARMPCHRSCPAACARVMSLVVCEDHIQIARPHTMQYLEFRCYRLHPHLDRMHS